MGSRRHEHALEHRKASCQRALGAADAEGPCKGKSEILLLKYFNNRFDHIKCDLKRNRILDGNNNK